MAELERFWPSIFDGVQMIFAAGFGLGLGAVAGLSVGPYIFGRMNVPKAYSKVLSELADSDRMSDAPDPGTAVTEEMRSLLPFTEPWTVSPDYERVSMINRVLAVMWPTLTKAIMVEVLKQVRPQLEKQVFAKFKFIEDIVLGTQSMKDAGTWEAWIKDKDFTIGSVPPRVGGIKSYSTTDDEVILEIPLVWGSDCKLDIGVFLRAGPLRLYVPLEISHLHFKAESRITIKPLVEEIPCVGGVTVSLLKAPHVDLSIKLIKGVDLLALPLIQDGLRFAIQHFLNGMVIYPNVISHAIMKNFGVPEPPKGALNIKLLRGENIKHGDNTYVKLEVRAGRSVNSNTINGNTSPEYSQEFNMIVDDFKSQSLKMTVFNDDLGWNDTPLSTGTVAFGEVLSSVVSEDPTEVEFEVAEFIKNPMHEVLIAVPLDKYREQDPNLLMQGSKSFVKMGSMAKSFIKDNNKKQEGYGTLYLKVMFMPFLQPTFDDEEEEEAKKLKKAKLPPRPAGRVVNHHINERTKGVLTVQLIRCINLMGDAPTTWVRLLATDEEADVDQEHRSTSVFTENSPRWGDKFDFVMITAGSMLHLTVYDKVTSMTSLISTVNVFARKKKAEGEKDKILGKLAINVKDVVRNGSIKDIYTLQDTERGQIELALSWQTCEIPESH